MSTAADAGIPSRPTVPDQTTTPRTRYWCELLWDGRGQLLRDVLLTVGDRYEDVEPGVRTPPPDAVRLNGFSMPGLANVHSHAFHRALRGRTHRAAGSFWTWREQMYRAADRLTPDSYLDLARAVYAEMALAGITSVGEFHYLHHAPGGTRYDDPNAMSAALVAAAGDAGVRITVLDTCYLDGGLGADGRPVPLAGPQLRFGDGDADGWLDRAASFRPDGAHAVVGKAVHSVRAVPPEAIRTVVDAPFGAAAVHAHVSEQRAENEACRAAYGRTPTQVLADAGALSASSTVVHATHLTTTDRDLLLERRSRVCLCPTTERDLADGIGPATDFPAPTLCLGSDSNAVIDLYEEARAVELDERLRTETRGHLSAAALLTAATSGHDALMWNDAGRIGLGARADLVTVDTNSVRLAGTADWSDDADVLAAVVFAATSADVRHVLVDGRQVVRDGVHQSVEDVPGRLARSIGGLLS